MHKSKRWTMASAIWFPLTFCLATQSHASPPCYETTLKEKPFWISGATWLDKSSELLILDPMQNKLLAYDSGGTSRQLPPLALKSSEEFQPNSIAPVPQGGFLLELADGGLVPLDQRLKARDEEAILPREKDANGFRLGSLFQWKVAGNYIVAYGSLLKGESPFFGFFRLKLGVPENPEVLTPEDDSSFYLIGNNYITTIGDTAYYVVMDKHPAIYKADPGRPAERIKSFPEDADLRTRPDFKTRMAGPKSAGAHFAELESFTVVSGLYSQGGQLFLLTRKPDSLGQTAWFLYKIDPNADPAKKPLGPPLRLPTSANHLTVVPTSNSWFLIERRAVKTPQSQLIDKMVVIPSASIASMTKLPRACQAR